MLLLSLCLICVCIRTLTDAVQFGEMALIERGGTRRVASILSSTLLMTEELSRHSLESLSEDFPQLRDHLDSIAAERAADISDENMDKVGAVKTLALTCSAASKLRMLSQKRKARESTCRRLALGGHLDILSKRARKTSSSQHEQHCRPVDCQPSAIPGGAAAKYHEHSVRRKGRGIQTSTESLIATLAGREHHRVRFAAHTSRVVPSASAADELLTSLRSPPRLATEATEELDELKTAVSQMRAEQGRMAQQMKQQKAMLETTLERLSQVLDGCAHTVGSATGAASTMQVESLTDG